ncbi:MULTISPECIES: 3-oxoacid CoA-transferase subunit A [unclassified Variovorax]|jgi:3-oxoadipate CoA-transferase, alpha subunit|uniref:3-oxoacid CoA-transferase subunit A n=1 Tax=unclassified Variovorax TaxID=663243 RepID=UPI00086E10C2|nr:MULTISPECIES: 3-oxoacid CoA-transferase subunit A [unclassified Variovorax]MBN8755645.1 3-oxoacid CoA-transferase subunit A [Variovorax sp.]ODU19198.1 MAG: 3-oxoadipate CoA-transferase [Variovorax sp. SCN 67-85]ODV23369.1 MAG: 3-oxoadipate CoA-transferase [Variovorax sp. SCN 67-20]OJZ16001.1 MAG: 3-oxoadipate CoA-transferase [Variovorax sp. 67-131]
MRNVVVEDAHAAVRGLSDGDTVMVGGFGGAGLPRRIIKAVLDLNVRELTVISNNAGAGGEDLSLWFGARIVRKIVCSYPRSADVFAQQYRAGTVELELVPQGTLVERIRAGGAGLGGFLTPVGVGTVFEKGKQKIHLKGRDYLLEEPLHAQFSFLKGRQADPLGNVNYNKTARNHSAVMATAGATVAIEVDQLVHAGEMDPEGIVTPCIFVDRVFLSRSS